MSDRQKCTSVGLVLALFGLVGVDTGCKGCPDPVDISTQAQLASFIDELTWNFTGPYSNKRLPISNDTRIVGTLTVDFSALSGPEQCQAADCRKTIGLQIPQGGIEGVSCTHQDSDYPHLCAEARFVDAVVRFQAAIVDHHPSQYNHVPVLTLQQSCKKPCPAGQYRCQIDSSCWPSYGAYCRLCEQRTKETCACQTAKGSQPDGAECAYMISGDVMTSGVCRAGVCSKK